MLLNVLTFAVHPKSGDRLAEIAATPARPSATGRPNSQWLEQDKKGSSRNQPGQDIERPVETFVSARSKAVILAVEARRPPSQRPLRCAFLKGWRQSFTFYLTPSVSAAASLRVAGRDSLGKHRARVRASSLPLSCLVFSL